MKENNYEKWLESCLQAGIPAIRMDTCARLMAILLVYTPSEEFTHCPKAIAETKYIQNRFDIKECGTPRSDFRELLNKYKGELELRIAAYPNLQDNQKRYTQWAIDLYKERYNIKAFI